jgi:hypothetical protein
MASVVGPGYQCHVPGKASAAAKSVAGALLVAAPHDPIGLIDQVTSRP